LRPTRHRLGFGKGQTRVTDVERERLRIFLAATKLGSGARVTVVGHGKGRRGQRRARKRAVRVVALLRQMGVTEASIAEPEVAPDGSGAGGRVVTIAIRKR
jgi:type IV pilus biogenesis protein CpaD/CtpE